MLVREVGELLRSIDFPSISNPNENRSESLPACLVVVVKSISYLPDERRYLKMFMISSSMINQRYLKNFKIKSMTSIDNF